MKRLLLSAAFLCGIAKAQNVTIDTVAQKYLVCDTSHYYDMYSNNGRMVRKNISSPFTPIQGYYYIRKGYTNPYVYIDDGYEVRQQVQGEYGYTILANLNGNKVKYPVPYIPVSYGLPVNGF